MTRAERTYYVVSGLYTLAQFFIAPIYPLQHFQARLRKVFRPERGLRSGVPWGARSWSSGATSWTEQTEKIALPFFFQIERNDVLDAGVALRYQFAEGGFVAANATAPLNEDGLRANVIPTVQVEYAF